MVRSGESLIQRHGLPCQENSKKKTWFRKGFSRRFDATIPCETGRSGTMPPKGGITRMETTNWHWRREYPVAPAKLDAVNEARSLWHETPGEIEDALEYGREKARLLRWVRRHMKSKLSARERRCVELLFFRGLTYREVAERTGTHPSVVHRAVQRGLVKLRRQLADRRTRARLRVTRFENAATRGRRE